jgi:hypothetical protein
MPATRDRSQPRHRRRHRRRQRGLWSERDLKALGAFLLEFDTLSEVRVLGAFLALGSPSGVTWDELKVTIAGARERGEKTGASTVDRGIRGLAARDVLSRREVARQRYRYLRGSRLEALISGSEDV